MGELRRFSSVGGFILIGGESSRMGRDKALLELAGEPLVVRTAKLLATLVNSLTIVGSTPLPKEFGLRVIPDDRVGIGPLSAISTVLRTTAFAWNLVVACDMPYLTAEWLRYLITRAEASSDAAVILPESVGGLEPLCAMYHKRAAARIAAALERGVRKITDGLADLPLVTILPAEWKAFDSRGLLFKNMNTPADYQETRAALQGNAAE